MKTILIVISCIVAATISIAPSLNAEMASAQMMNPNMMTNMMGGMGSGMMNPNMMNTNMMNMMGMMNPNMTKVMMGMFAGHNVTGTIKLLPTIMNAVESQIKVKLGDAVMNAEKELGNNTQIVSAHVGDENGYLVYIICGIDKDSNIHTVIVDPGDGKALLSQKFSMMQMMNMMHMMGGIGGMMNNMMMNSNMMGSMMNPNMMVNLMNKTSHMFR